MCGKCATNQIQKCNHSDGQRVLENTWVLLEVLEALILGYKVVKIFEICNIPTTEKNNKTDQSGGLLTDNVNTFLRIKQGASGSPYWVQTEADKKKYIDTFFQIEGIQWIKQNIGENQGLKSLS